MLIKKSKQNVNYVLYVKASIMALFTPIGALIVGPIMDRIGRKKACLLTCLPLLTSWTISAVSSSDNVYMFYASRMLAGIGGGIISSCKSLKTMSPWNVRKFVDLLPNLFRYDHGGHSIRVGNQSRVLQAAAVVTQQRVLFWRRAAFHNFGVFALVRRQPNVHRVHCRQHNSHRGVHAGEPDMAVEV